MGVQLASGDRSILPRRSRVRTGKNGPMAATVTPLDADACSVRVVDADRVDAARRRLIPPDEVNRVTDLFRMLGDPTRVQILYALGEAGELCVCDIAAVVDMTETAVSHALRLLRAAGIVRNRRSGRMVYYSLDDAHVRLLLDVSAEHLRHQRLAPTVDEPASKP